MSRPLKCKRWIRTPRFVLARGKAVMSDLNKRTDVITSSFEKRVCRINNFHTKSEP